MDAQCVAVDTVDSVCVEYFSGSFKKRTVYVTYIKKLAHSIFPAGHPRDTHLN